VKLQEQGRIGAEKIFNFIRRFDHGDTLSALRKAVEIIRNRTRSIRAMNIILVKGRTVYLSTYFTGTRITSRCVTRKIRSWSSVRGLPFRRGWKGVANGTVGCGR